MAKKIGWGIAVAIMGIGVVVFAADSRPFEGIQKDLRAILEGILSPQQIKTLIDFKRIHEEKFQPEAGERPDLFGIWKKLDFSEEQQEQLLKVGGDLVDKTHPFLMAAAGTGSELKRKVLDGDPDDPAIKHLSTQLGKEIGDMAWNLALVRSQVRSVLTSEQIEIMERHREQHELGRKGALNAIPGMADDLAALWSKLNLTPKQADALEAAHRLIKRYRQDQHKRKYDEWRVELAKILNSGQLAVADRFHENHLASGEAHFLKRDEERTRFLNELGLTGEQKIKLVQFALDRRARIVPAIENVITAAQELRERVHADIPDRSGITAAAARLGDAIGQAAEVGAGLMADAGEVLTTEQIVLVKGHITDLGDQRLEHARIMPAKFHELIDFLHELGLNPRQKDQIIKLISDKHEAQRAKPHFGMKSFF